jgi:hypothetical protein
MNKKQAIFYFFLLVFVPCIFVISGISQQGNKKITLRFEHKIGTTLLQLGDTVKNLHGEAMTIQKFKYYLSNFAVITSANKTVPLQPAYYLIDEADSLSKTITLSIPHLPIRGIRFMIGVDSLHNVSGIQTGTLDPVKTMFWTWHSGYIFAKLEGESPASNQAGNLFAYHIGGFKKGFDATRTIELVLSRNAQESTPIHITADIDKWFSGPFRLSIAATPNCQSPGALAIQIANNYANMFSVN